MRIRPAHRDYWRAEPHAEEWLLIGWSREEKEPTKYWLSTLPADTTIDDLVYFARHRWIIERDYQELKQELGLGHFEGRGWRGFHHHAALCIAAYGFLVSERSRFSPSARAGHLRLRTAEPPKRFRPRGSPSAPRVAQSAFDHDFENGHRPLSARVASALPLLRIPFRIVFRVDIGINDAGCRA